MRLASSRAWHGACDWGGAMNRQPLRTLSVVLFPLVAAALGCADEPSDIAYESTETQDESGALDVGDDEGPTVEIMLDGDTGVNTIRSAGELHLLAEADATLGISVVEFYLDDELISSDATEPYAASMMIPDASFNGNRFLTARAYDSSGNMGESSIPLEVTLPESGTVSWEYIGPGEGQRWVVVGADDSAMVVSSREMLRISTEGTLLSTYEFTYDVSAVTANGDGGVIAVGAIDGTLVIQRFTSDGVPIYLDLIEEFGDPTMSVTEVALSGDDHLVISSMNASHAGDTARISSVALADEAALEWHRYLIHDNHPTDNSRATNVAVAPSGEIFTTPTFDVPGHDVYLQLRKFEPNGAGSSSFDDLVNYRWSYNDVVATEHGVFVAARLSDQAVIGRFDLDGEPTAMYYIDADNALALEPVGDELVYASRMQNHSTKLGRISMDGDERWSKYLGGSDTIHDIALTSDGHMYVVSGIDPGAWRLRRVHP
jgi:hypothetical protein